MDSVTMSNLNSNEEIKDFSEPLLSGNVFHPVVQKCVSHIVEKEGFVEYDANVKDISTNGGNYLATLQELDIRGKNAHGVKEVNLFLKNRMIVDDFDVFPLDEVYSREAFYYNELVKIYNKFQDDANIPEGDRYRTVKSYDDSNEDVIFLENLSKKGYTSWHRLKEISFEFAKLSMEQLAKFHSLSFVLKSKMPQFFEKKIKPMKSPYNIDSQFKDYIKNSFDTALTYLEGESKAKMENFYSKMIESYKKLANISDADAICLCHGDFRPNNMLMIENNDKIEDILLVDFQFIICGRPATDFVFFLFTGTDQEFRRAHLNNLKDSYYDTLGRFLKYFDIDAEDVYPRERFEKELIEELIYGLTNGLIVIPFIFCDVDQVPDIHDKADVKFEWNEKAKKRWRGLVEDVILWQKI